MLKLTSAVAPVFLEEAKVDLHSPLKANLLKKVNIAIQNCGIKWLCTKSVAVTTLQTWATML